MPERAFASSESRKPELRASRPRGLRYELATERRALQGAVASLLAIDGRLDAMVTHESIVDLLAALRTRSSDRMSCIVRLVRDLALD